MAKNLNLEPDVEMADQEYEVINPNPNQMGILRGGGKIRAHKRLQSQDGQILKWQHREGIKRSQWINQKISYEIWENDLDELDQPKRSKFGLNHLCSQCGKREVSDSIMRKRQLKNTSLCISDGLRGQIGGTQSGHYRQAGTRTGTATGKAGTGGTVHSPQLIKFKAELAFFLHPFSLIL